MNKKDVTLFWQWFADNAASMDNERRKDTFLAGIDDQVEALGDFAWEIGPGYQTGNMFVLSPHGNKELLKETQSIIEEAPKLTNWEFYYAKQPTQAQLKFILYTDNREFEFDATDWQYILFGFSNNAFDILVKADNLIELSSDDKELAVKLALDGLIGEEKRIVLMEEIEIVNDFDKEHISSASQFSLLLKHLKQVFSADFR